MAGFSVNIPSLKSEKLNNYINDSIDRSNVNFGEINSKNINSSIDTNRTVFSSTSKEDYGNVESFDFDSSQKKSDIKIDVPSDKNDGSRNINFSKNTSSNIYKNSSTNSSNVSNQFDSNINSNTTKINSPYETNEMSNQQVNSISNKQTTISSKNLSNNKASSNINYQSNYSGNSNINSNTNLNFGSNYNNGNEKTNAPNQINTNFNNNNSFDGNNNSSDKFSFDDTLNSSSETKNDIDVEEFNDELKIKIDEYKKALNQQINFYEELFDEAEKEIKNLESKGFDDMGNSFAQRFQIYQTMLQSADAYVIRMVEGYKIYCSDKKLRELGITNKELQDMTFADLLELCKKKDSDVLAQYEAAESYKKELDKIVKDKLGLDSYEDYLEKINDLNEDKAIIESAIYKVKQLKKNAKYEIIILSDDYINYNYSKEIDKSKINEFNTGTKKIIDYERYEGEISPLDYLMQVNEIYGHNNIYQVNVENKDDLQAILDMSSDNPDIAKLYNFLYYTSGKEAADQYIEDIKDQINSYQGKKKAEEFLNTLIIDENGNYDYTSILNHFKTSVKGTGDGIESFFSGIAAWLNSDDVYSVDEYESIYILEALQENKDFVNFLDNNYEISKSIGNMLPSIAVSFATSPIIGTISMGVSAGGNSYHNALVEGYDKGNALLYGVLSGTSEALLEKYMGAIPGLSDVNVTSLKTFSQAMLREGIEEGTQEYIDALMQYGILGKNFNLEDVTKNATKSALYGAIIGGIMNSPNLVRSSFSKNDITGINEGNINKANIRNDSNNFEIDEIVNNETEITSPIIPINRLKSILENDDVYRKFLDFENNKEAFPDFDQKTYVSSLNQLYEILKKNNYGISKEFENRIKYINNMYSKNKKFSELLNIDKISTISDLYNTSKIISIDKLESILKDESIYNKFLNFENNREFFGSISKQNYINGIIELNEALKKQNIEVDSIIKNRINKISEMSEFSKIDVVNAINDLDMFEIDVGPELKKSLPVQKLVDILYDENLYNIFLDFENYSNYFRNGEKNDYLSAFLQLNNIIDKNSLQIPNYIKERLNNLVNEYLNVLNRIDDTLRNYSTYGADQASIQVLLDTVSPDSSVYKELFDIIDVYFPKMSKKEKIKYLSGIDSGRGVCSYATAINEILLLFEGKENLFKQYFGYDMYVERDGLKVLNTSTILLDLYSFANANNTNINKKKFLFGWKNIDNDKSSIGISNAAYRNIDIIQQFLASKGLNFNLNNDVIFSNWQYNLNASLIGDKAIQNIREKIMNSLISGKKVDLCVFRASNIDGNVDFSRNFTFYPLGPEGRLVNSNTWSEGAGHSISVTGFTEQGDLIISSWGKRYQLKFDELKNAVLTIFSTSYDDRGD